MSFEPCFNLALRQSNRVLTQFYDERLAPFGLKSGQFSVLRVVFLRKTTTNKELQHLLVIDQTTLSRNLKPLVRDNFLTLTVDANDQRVKNIQLSEEGAALYHAALPAWQSAQQSLVDKLGKGNADAILSLADELVAHLSAP